MEFTENGDGVKYTIFSCHLKLSFPEYLCGLVDWEVVLRLEPEWQTNKG